MENEAFSLPVLLELVKEEATKLKQVATPDELANLSLEHLYNTTDRCVYGQMTGNCFSNRATEMIHECCVRVYVATSGGAMGDQPVLNGSPIGKKRSSFGNQYYSPIEILLGEETIGGQAPRFDSKIVQVVKYLKGDTETLDL